LVFFLFLVLNVALYVRPEELVGGFFGGQLYLVTMCCILPLTAGRIIDRLSKLRVDPVSCCVLAFYLFAIGSSLLSIGFSGARQAAQGFGKVVVAYFIAVVVLSDPRNFLRYLVVLPIILASIAGIGMLQYFEIVDNPAIALCKEVEKDDQGNIVEHHVRLASSGIFGDPNDLCLAIAVGLALCIYHLVERSGPVSILESLTLIPFLIFAFVLTKSRGGLLSISSMIVSLFVSRFGPRWGMPLAALGVITLAGLSTGRQTSIDASKGTAQGRIQLWSDGIEEWKTSPLVGIGCGEYKERVSLVAHNSYIHGFVETGPLGGTAFIGIFACLFMGLISTPRIDDDETTLEEMKVNRCRPFIIAGLVGYCVGMYSLSRNYVIPTYMMAAIGNSCLWISHPPSERTWFVMNGDMTRRLATIGAFIFAGLITFVKVFVSYE